MGRAIADIEALLAAMERYGIECIELDDALGYLAIVLPACPTAASAPAASTRPSDAPEEGHGSLARATIAGRFLPAHPWRAKPFAELGKRVVVGEIIGLVQVGGLYIPVTAPVDGVIDAILAESGALVGYGSPLLRLGI